MDKYEFVRDIGSGSFGLTKLMKNKETKELVAVKCIEKGPQVNENVAKEINNHRSVRHPNIIRFKEVLLTPTHLMIVMEYASGGELLERISRAGRFSEDEQLISGVSYCHAMQVSHGDLKLANILLDGSPAGRLKICDFGFSTSNLLHSRPKSIAGTLRYIAPEVLSGREYDGKLADVWSCGVTSYVMLVGAYPFEDQKEPQNHQKTMQRILGAQYKIPSYVHISEECRDLISRMFVANARRRKTIREIQNHPWFLKNLPQDLSATGQAIHYRKSDSTYPLQSIESIKKIVEEARKPLMIYSSSVSSSIKGFGYATPMLNQLHDDHTDPFPLPATSFDQSMSGIRLPERSILTDQLHSYHPDPPISQSVSYTKKATNPKLLDSSMYVRSAERSINFAGNHTNAEPKDSSMYSVRSAERSLDPNVLHPYQSHPSVYRTNPKLFDPSISDVLSSEKSMKSNASYQSEPSAYQLQSLGFHSKLLDIKSLTQVASSDLSMSDVHPPEKSIIPNKMHYHIDPSGSNLHAKGKKFCKF
ncbi:hypothetical protein DCAR_0313425 [Daucus carota subsp. sativus]|uniref:non-specific serine/threonine protein kinase n=1 Tax=Daucus carota subsp. sativus TaxID=79200 RepID=A0AAF0WQ77_DAUCS|nr:hypothetical protein DCAR_0313425 [Daucus carota subsp. sativus]